MEYKSKFTGEEIDALLTEVQEGGNLGEIKEQIANKADRNGHYPEFTAGFADNLVGRGEAIPAEFSFRASGGKSIEDGSARIKTLHGNAVVWNQMQNNVEGITVKNTTKTVTNNKYELMANTSSMAGKLYQENYRPELIANHKCIIVSDCTNSRGAEPKLNIGSYYGAINKVFTAPSDGAVIFFPFGTSDQINAGETATFSYIKVHDLTKMFGAGNEPLTIEEYNARKPIVADENSYSEGEVIPFTAEGVKSIGDNAWGGELEKGRITNGKDDNANQNMARGKGYVKVLPNSAYYGTCKYYIFASFYDADKNFIGDTNAVQAFTTPSNAQYLRFFLYNSNGNVELDTDVCISLVHSGYKEGKYFPYEQDIRKIDKRILDAFPNGMMPWDKVYNKNGKGYIVKGSGSVEDMSLLNWEVGFGGFYTSDIRHNIKHLYDYNLPSNMLCSRFATNHVASDDAGISLIYGGSVDYPYNGNIKVVGYDSIDSLLADLQGIPLYYQLAEPAVIEYDEPFNLDYLVWDFGTEEIIADKPSAPLKADIIYQFNAVDEIRELRAMIATMQAQLANMTNIN